MSIPPPSFPEDGPRQAPFAAGNGPPAFPPSPTPFATPQHAEYSGLWLRVAAVLLDGLIIGAPIFVLSLVLAVAGTGSSPLAGLLRLVLGYGLSAGYYLGTMTRPGARNGQTFGKQLVGIRVLRDDGLPVRGGTVLRREVLLKGLLAAFTLGIFGLFDYLWPLGDATNRALHDKIVRTHVVLDPGRSRTARSVFVMIAAGFAGIVLFGIVLAVVIPVFLNRQPVSTQQNVAQVQALEQEMGIAFTVEQQTALRNTPPQLDTGAQLVGDIALAQPGLDNALASSGDPGAAAARAGVIYLGATTPRAFEAVGYTADGTRVACGVTSSLGPACSVSGG